MDLVERPPDPWQRLSLDVMLAVNTSGQWSAFEFAELVARQNGKGDILLARELAGLLLFGEKLILHSAHEFKTAAEAFLRLKSVVDNFDWIRKRVAKVRTAHGDEGIELTRAAGGGRLRFVARSKSSGRGFSPGTVILDEAQELPTVAVDALMPTVSAQPNPQLVYTGTVPSETNNGEHFTRLRDRGRSGGDESLAWVEYSAGDGSEPVDLGDETLMLQANPAAEVGRLTVPYMRRERASMNPASYARERLSLWGAFSADTVIDMSVWAHLRDEHSSPDDPVMFSLDMNPERTWVAIGVAGRRPDGRLHLEVAEHRQHTAWAPPTLRAMVAKWATCGPVQVARSSPAAALAPDLEEEGLEVELVGGSEEAAACGALVDRANEGKLRHLGQAPLSVALAGAVKRPVGDGAFTWQRRDISTDISPLYAVTLAAHGFTRHAGNDAEVDIWL